MHYMLHTATQHFEPKRVLKPGDWLATQRERGQTIMEYNSGNGIIEWIHSSHKRVEKDATTGDYQNKQTEQIYLLLLDNMISRRAQSDIVSYCTAYFHGIPVKMVGAGSEILERLQNGEKQKKHTVPDDFVSHHNIYKRQHYGKEQLQAVEILEALKTYMTNDTYQIVAITMRDLYPRKNWNFVEGLSDHRSRVGVVSFGRHSAFLNSKLSEEQQHSQLLKRSLPTLMRAMCENFGLRSCIYYECTMNATNSADENERNEKYRLCPICTCKLRSNINFNTMERFNKLTEVCAEIGLVTESHSYDQLMSAWLQNQ